MGLSRKRGKVARKTRVQNSRSSRRSRSRRTTQVNRNNNSNNINRRRSKKGKRSRRRSKRGGSNKPDVDRPSTGLVAAARGDVAIFAPLVPSAPSAEEMERVVALQATLGVNAPDARPSAPPTDDPPPVYTEIGALTEDQLSAAFGPVPAYTPIDPAEDEAIQARAHGSQGRILPVNPVQLTSAKSGLEQIEAQCLGSWETYDGFVEGFSNCDAFRYLKRRLMTGDPNRPTVQASNNNVSGYNSMDEQGWGDIGNYPDIVFLLKHNGKEQYAINPSYYKSSNTELGRQVLNKARSIVYFINNTTQAGFDDVKEKLETRPPP
jgi:hypothetical protein